jgi:simple sugar transport system permease protein
MAGLAGGLEVAGPLGQLTPHVPVGYGFAAIIVAFVGRLHPLGIVFSAVLMSMFYIGGELAQSRLGLPKSLTGVFQGLLLFSLLACDTLIVYRLRWKGAPPEPAEPVSTMAGGGQIGTTQALPGRGLGPIGPSGLTAKEGA